MLSAALNLKKLTLNAAGTLGRQVGAGVFQIVTLIVIARVYGAEGNGVYSLALLLPTTLAALLNLGISPANIYFLGSGKVTHHTAVRSSMKLFLVATLIGCFLGIFVVWKFSGQVFPGVPKLTLWISIAIFPLILLVGILSSIFQGMQRFRLYNYLALIPPLVTLTIVVVMVLFGVSNIVYLLIAYFFGFLIALFYGWYCFLSIGLNSSIIDPENYTFDVIKYGYKAHISNLVSLFNYKLDLFLVNIFIGPAAAGIYVVAVQLVERLWLLAQAVSTVLLPRLSELKDREDLKAEMTPLASRWVFSLTIMASVLLAAIGYPLLRCVFGEEFVSAFSPLLYLLPGIVAGALSKIVASDIAARGKPELNMYTTLASLPLNLVGNFIMIPRMGISGAAVATTFTYVLILIMILFVYRNITGISPFKLMLLGKSDVVRILCRSP